MLKGNPYCDACLPEEEDYNPQDCAHCTEVGAHICEPCEGEWHK